MRKLLDFVNGKWAYSNNPKKKEQMGTKEEWAVG